MLIYARLINDNYELRASDKEIIIEMKNVTSIIKTERFIEIDDKQMTIFDVKNIAGQSLLVVSNFIEMIFENTKENK